MPSAAEYIARMSEIVGYDVTNDRATINFTWMNHDEGRVAIQRIRVIQKQLRLLKQEVTAFVSAIKSEFTTARTKVGKSFGAGLAAGFFGRKTMGRANASYRDGLRRRQMQTVAPFDSVKNAIDRMLASLDQVKGQIELSPQYQIRTSSVETKALPANHSPILASDLPALPAPQTKYYLYVAGEVKGPYSNEQLLLLRDMGSVNDDTQVCMEGSEVWNPFIQLQL